MQPQAHSNAQSDDTVPDFSEWETVNGLSDLTEGKISVSQLRWQLRFRKENGLSKAVVKVGKTLYIHVPTYFKMVFDAQRGAA